MKGATGDAMIGKHKKIAVPKTYRKNDRMILDSEKEVPKCLRPKGKASKMKLEDHHYHDPRRKMRESNANVP